jgi:WD40 repeat protein
MDSIQLHRAPDLTTVNGTGSITLWHFDQEQPLWSFARGANHAKVNSIHFEPYGNKFGIATTDGQLQLWRFMSSRENNEPFVAINAREAAWFTRPMFTLIFEAWFGVWGLLVRCLGFWLWVWGWSLGCRVGISIAASFIDCASSLDACCM